MLMSVTMLLALMCMMLLPAYGSWDTDEDTPAEKKTGLYGVGIPKRCDPPPGETLGWLTSPLHGAWAAAGAVAVALDPPETERWLGPMHAHARAPLLLWRPPEDDTPSPEWLEGRAAYVLLLPTFQSGINFMFKGTAGVVTDPGGKGWHASIPLKTYLNSAAPMIIVLNDEHGSKYMDLQRIGGLLAFMWQQQHLYRLIFVFLLHRRNWLVMEMDQFRQNNKIGLWLSNEFGQDYEDHTALMNRRLRNAGGYRVAIYHPMYRELTRTKAFIDNTLFDVKGDKHVILYELGKRLNITWVKSSEVFSYHLDRLTKNLKVHPSEEDSEYYLLSMGANAFVPRLLPITEGKFHRVAATCEFLDIVVVVAVAPPPSGSWRPLGVWGYGVWLALAGTVLAYALAWRVAAGESLAESVAAALRVFSSCGGSPQDRVRATPQRLQMAAALLASVVVTATVQMGFCLFIIFPLTANEMDNKDQLVDSKLPLYITNEHLKDMLKDRFEQEEGNTGLENRSSPLEIYHTDSEEVVMRVEAGEDLATAWYSKNWQITSSILGWERPVRPMKQFRFKEMMCACTCRNWPWTNAVNEKILEFHAAGLTKKWYSNYERGLIFLSRAAFKVKPEWNNILANTTRHAQQKPLSLQEVYAHITVLGVGLAAATYAFYRENTSQGHVGCRWLFSVTLVLRSVRETLLKWLRRIRDFCFDNTTAARQRSYVSSASSANSVYSDTSW